MEHYRRCLILTVNEIMEWMLSEVPPNYDISEGSFFYDLLYPVAVQIYLLQTKVNGLTDEAFAMTATGEYLDRKAAEQGLTRRSAGYSKGTVKINGRAGEIVRAGSKVSADNILFSIDETVSIPESEVIEIGATCTIGGYVGNVKAGAINRFPVTLPGLSSVTNEHDFDGGYDAESDDDLRERYFEKVSRPNTSGNKYHYISWAKEVSGVGDAKVIPLWNGPGTVKVVVIDINGEPADDELIQAVTSHIEERRPIGANVTVVSANSINISVSVKLISNTDVYDKISDSIKEYLSTAVEFGYVSYAKIGSLILSVDDVQDYSDLTINGGTSNISIPDDSVPVLESLVIT